jgi:hypothetical protein
MKEPLMRIGKSQMRVLSSRSSEMRLHLNRVGTAANCIRDHDCAPDWFAGASHLAIDVKHQTASHKWGRQNLNCRIAIQLLIPPAPSGERISERPSFVPAAMLILCAQAVSLITAADRRGARGQQTAGLIAGCLILGRP